MSNDHTRGLCPHCKKRWLCPVGVEIEHVNRGGARETKYRYRRRCASCGGYVEVYPDKQVLLIPPENSKNHNWNQSDPNYIYM